MVNKSKIIMNSGGGGKIEINTPPGSRVETNADEITMIGVRQNSFGGKISHNATNQLNQSGNDMLASNGGKIINQSEGRLNQFGNTMKAESGGEIRNVVKKGITLVVIIGLIASIITIVEFFNR